MKLFLVIVAVSCLSQGTTLVSHQHIILSIVLRRSTQIRWAFNTQLQHVTPRPLLDIISEAAGADMNDIGDATNEEVLGLNSIIVAVPTSLLTKH